MATFNATPTTCKRGLAVVPVQWEWTWGVMGNDVSLWGLSRWCCCVLWTRVGVEGHAMCQYGVRCEVRWKLEAPAVLRGTAVVTFISTCAYVHTHRQSHYQMLNIRMSLTAVLPRPRRLCPLWHVVVCAVCTAGTRCTAHSTLGV
jgi:hypothetical protein